MIVWHVFFALNSITILRHSFCHPNHFLNYFAIHRSYLNYDPESFVQYFQVYYFFLFFLSPFCIGDSEIHGMCERPLLWLPLLLLLRDSWKSHHSRPAWNKAAVWMLKKIPSPKLITQHLSVTMFAEVST